MQNAECKMQNEGGLGGRFMNRHYGSGERATDCGASLAIETSEDNLLNRVFIFDFVKKTLDKSALIC